MSNSGNQITTYGLIDSGSDITMIDPCIVKLLNIEGAPSKLTLTTVNNADVEEGVKVNFKIAPVHSQNDRVLNVNSAWAVKDLTIRLGFTVFAEVTSILNSRPICSSSDDPKDMEPLTPNHLLLQRRNLFVPPGIFAKEDVYSRKQWRHAQFIANCFWSRWVREYVPMLQHRHKWLLNRRNLAVNDLVLVVDNTLPRCRWLLGRVTKVCFQVKMHVCVLQR